MGLWSVKAESVPRIARTVTVHPDEPGVLGMSVYHADSQAPEPFNNRRPVLFDVPVKPTTGSSLERVADGRHGIVHFTKNFLHDLLAVVELPMNHPDGRRKAVVDVKVEFPGQTISNETELCTWAAAIAANQVLERQLDTDVIKEVRQLQVAVAAGA